MISKPVFILALFSQVVTAFGRTAFVLCVHQSGQTQIEFSASPCCADLETCERANQAEGREVMADSACGDPCSDYPLPISEARLQASSERQTLAAGLVQVNDLSSLASILTPSIPFAGESIPIFALPPLGADTLSLLRTVVLLV